MNPAINTPTPLSPMNRFLHDLPALLSIMAAIASWQEQITWTLQILGAIVAVVAGCLAIYRHFKKGS